MNENDVDDWHGVLCCAWCSFYQAIECVRSSRCSYHHIIKVLKKVYTEHDYTQHHTFPHEH